MRRNAEMNIFMLSIVMLSIIMLSIFMLSIVMLSLVMLSIVMLSVAASQICGLYYKHITTVKDGSRVVSDAPNCGVTYDSSRLG